MKTILAHRRGGKIRVVVVDRWHRARRSIRSMRARGVPDLLIASALGVDPERLDGIAATAAPAPWWK